VDGERCRLYLISPPELDPRNFSQNLAQALDGGDVAAVQLRIKEADDDAIRRAVNVLSPVCRDRNVLLILNDRPDLAAECGCDGVHIGQQDTPYAKARDILGPESIIGVTCHDSRHLGIEAAEQGADYVAFGAFFPTKTKDANTEAPLEILEWWSDLMLIPVVAIGGITPENCTPLIRAGADFLAVVSAVWDHPEGPAAGVKAFDDAITAAC